MHKSVNPDNVVAEGAAFLCAMKSGQIPDDLMQFSDVTLNNVGMKVYD